MKQGVPAARGPRSGCAGAAARPSCVPVTPSDPRVYRRYAIRIPLELGAGGRLETLETEDVSQGGCRVVVMFPLRKGELVRVRLRSPQLEVEPSGAAVVAWTTRDPPYRAGLRFSEELAAQMPSYLRTLLGPVPLLTRESGS